MEVLCGLRNDYRWEPLFWWIMTLAQKKRAATMTLLTPWSDCCQGLPSTWKTPKLKPLVLLREYVYVKNKCISNILYVYIYIYILYVYMCIHAYIYIYMHIPISSFLAMISHFCCSKATLCHWCHQSSSLCSPPGHPTDSAPVPPPGLGRRSCSEPTRYPLVI